MSEEQVRQVFNDLLKDFEGANQMRDWDNAAAGNAYDENKSITKQRVQTYRNRFEKAMEVE